MTQYQIDISIDSAGLQAIYGAGQRVAVVKGVASLVDAARLAALPPVTVGWLVFQPLQTNQITWTESYAVYASSSALPPGAVIDVGAWSPAAEPGWIYTLEDGQISAAAGGVADAFTAVNQMRNGFCFGLLQEAVVNGAPVCTPESALPVLYNESAVLAPSASAWIFLTSAASGGTVLYRVPDTALSLTLTSQSPTATVGFNDHDNTFYVSE
ncbi:hypothetical protein [Sorangium sp. So ce1000]|uniref:hypothetical protein n=1 Tax=Sorangium sp. So ce1000 TaxID=3133325 RepID=UPI003F641B8E